MNQYNNIPDRSIRFAVERCNAALLKLLLDNGRNPYSKTRGVNSTPLHEAAKCDSIELVKIIIDFADKCPPKNNIFMNAQEYINFVDMWGKTALYYTIANANRAESTHLLLQKGAKMNMRDYTEQRYTPLEYAIIRRNYVAAEMIVKYERINVD